MRSARCALIVGIDDYPHAPLSGCVNDALAIGNLLRSNSDGSPNFDTRLITAPSDTITRYGLREQVAKLFSRQADMVLFYYSGHGTENNLGGFLVTPDVTSYTDGVAMTDILTMANKSRADEVVILLDCCHSGNLGAIPSIDNNAVYLREGVCILTASRSSEPAIESGGHGLFTSLVCGALDNGASDVIGDVTVAGIYAYVDQSLGPWQQRPLFKCFMSSLSPVRRCRPDVDMDVLRQLPKWFPSPLDEFALDPSYEPDAEPHDEEHERIFGYLQRCRAAKLVEPVGEQHMYYAAMNGKSCRLTPLGRHYWRLVNDGRI